MITFFSKPYRVRRVTLLAVEPFVRNTAKSRIHMSPEIQISEIESELPNMRLAGLKYSDKEAKGEPALALHGWMDNAASFEPLARYLPPSLQLLCYEMVGHGKSAPLPQTRPYHFVDYCQDIDDLCRSISWSRGIFIGHSMGGALATLIAASRPQLVSKLVLIDSPGPLTMSAEDAPDRLTRYLDERLVPQKPRFFGGLEEMAKVRAKVGPLSLENAQILVKRSAQETSQGWSFRTDPALRLPSPFRFSEDAIRAFFKKIEAPVLLITAKPGMFYEHHERVMERFSEVKNFQHQIVEGGHHIHMEKPQQVAECIKHFLDKNK